MKKILTILIFSVMSIYAQDEIKNYEIKNISANNRYLNFGATFYGNDKIVFSSSTGGRILNLFVGDIINEDVVSYHIFSKGSKSNTHQSNVAFTNDKKTVYFTKSIYGIENRKVSKQKKAIIALFKATISANGTWENITPMPFNDKTYDVGHPTLNRENTKLYFSSNMPGTIGKSDIFEVDILGGNNYSEPRNLGPNVNTSGNELFPFISGDNYLYFSSNGYTNNLGGLDIYSVQVTQSGVSKPVHLDKPINSSADDLSYIFNSDTRQGFFSSNRRGGKGSDDIYFFKEKEIEEVVEEVCTQKVEGTVFINATKKMIANAKIILKNRRGDIVDRYETKNDGLYYFEIDCNRTYYIEATKSGFGAMTKNLKTGSTTKVTNVDLFLVKNKEDKILVKNKNPSKKEIIPKKRNLKVGEIGFNYNESRLYKRYTFQLDKAIIRLIEKPNMKIEIESHTDCRAEDDFNMKLSEDRIFALTEYLSRKGISLRRIRGRAFGETAPINKCINGVSCTEEEYLINRRTTFKLIEK